MNLVEEFGEGFLEKEKLIFELELDMINRNKPGKK